MQPMTDMVLYREAMTVAMPLAVSYQDTFEAERVEPDLDAEEPGGCTDIVRAYLNGIGRTKLLTAEQEVILAKRIEAGLYAEEILGRDEPLDPAYAADLRII